MVPRCEATHVPRAIRSGIVPRRVTRYLCRPLADLAAQLRPARAANVHAYVRKAEKLHDQIDADAAYPIDFLAYRITGQRHLVESDDDTPLLPGEAVAADLRTLIDDLSRRHPLPLSPEDPVEFVDDLAARLNVSTKTLSRWRGRGLRSRWVLATAGQAVRAVPGEALERFTAADPQRVQRAARFTQISAEDKARLIERARRLRLARPGVSLNQVATHLARRSGRAVETLRQLLEKHDRDYPGDALFADHTGPLTAQQRRVIARAYRMGVPVSKIARHFRRTHSTIYRAIQDRRAAVIRRVPIRYVASRMFERDDADAVILRPQPEGVAASPPRTDVPVDDLPEALRPLYRQPELDPSLRQSLFVRFNYLKFKAARLREQLHLYEPRAGDLDRIEAWLREAAAVRERLFAAHLPVVLSVVRRHQLGRPAANTAALVDLLELGNQVLIDAIESFDVSRDHTFESTLTFTLMRRLATSTLEPRRAHRRVSGDEALQRLQSQAGESGIMLALRNDPPA